MKNLKKSDNREEIAEVIQGMMLDMKPIVSWEVMGDKSRVIFPVKLSDVNNFEEFLKFTSTKDENISFTGKTIFFFSEDQKVIFKAHLTETSGSTIKLDLPEVVKVLEDSDQDQFSNMIETFNKEMNFDAPVMDFNLDDDDDTEDDNDVDNVTSTLNVDSNWFTQDFSEHDANLFQTELNFITLDDEDKIFEEVRTAPRAKPPEGKMVTVQPQDESRAQASFILYDLSQGGVSFLVFAKEEFHTGEQVIIKAFDTSKFETPIIALVKAVREADDLGIQYKVGCQFVGAHQLEL